MTKQLTDRQNKILSLLELGFTHQQIADELKVSLRTVESELESIRIAYGVKKSRELLRETRKEI